MPPAYSAHLLPRITARTISAMVAKAERGAIRVPRELLERVDDFRFANRIPSRAEAVRRLVEDGLKANGPDAAAEATAKLGGAR